MTDRTPEEVAFDIFAQTYDGGDPVSLPAIDIVVTVDFESNFYATATLTLSEISDETFALLDPRQGPPPQVDWRVDQLALDSAGAWQIIGTLPVSPDSTNHATMLVREVERDHISGNVIVQLAGGESILEERRRVSGTALNTGQGNVANLVYWAILDCFPGATTPSFGPLASSTTIPVGDRRLMYQGESFADLIQPELDAIDYRLIDFFGRAWTCGARSTTSGTTLKLATYKGAPSDADPIVTGLTESASRNGDWADGVLIQYEWPNGTPAYHGALTNNTRTLSIKRDRPSPPTNAATPMLDRTLVRGYKIEAIARARFGITLGEASGISPQPLEIHTPTRILSGRLTAVEWRIGEGEMTLRAQTGSEIA